MCDEFTSNKFLALNNLCDISKVKSGNTGRPNRNLTVMLRFTKRHKTQGSLLKTWLSLKRISYFQVIFMLFWMT